MEHALEKAPNHVLGRVVLMANAVVEAISKRRSIRRYSPQVVSNTAVRRLLEIASWAPSAHNAQPWRFVVVSDRAVRGLLVDRMAEAYSKDLERDGLLEARRDLIESSRRLFLEAPALIVACLTMEKMHRYPDEKRRRAELVMGVQSLAASITTFLLAAHAEGYGACWFCAPLFCQDEVRQVLRMPSSVEPQAIITIGLPDEQPPPPTRINAESIVFENCWGRPLSLAGQV